MYKHRNVHLLAFRLRLQQSHLHREDAKTNYSLGTFYTDFQDVLHLLSKKPLRRPARRGLSILAWTDEEISEMKKKLE
jgi:hypothetical protein